MGMFRKWGRFSFFGKPFKMGTSLACGGNLHLVTGNNFSPRQEIPEGR